MPLSAQTRCCCYKMSITSMDSLSLGREKSICGKTASLLAPPPRRVWLESCSGINSPSSPRVRARLEIHLHGCDYYALGSLESSHYCIPRRKSGSTPTKSLVCFLCAFAHFGKTKRATHLRFHFSLSISGVLNSQQNPFILLCST